MTEEKENPFEDKLAQATILKNQGNNFFKDRFYDLARTKYQEALQLLEPSTFYGATQTQCQKLAELSATLLFNVASCCFNQEKWRQAEALYTEAVIINPNYCKALFKRSLARFNLQNYEGAMNDIKTAYGLDKSNPDIRQHYQRIRTKYNEQLKKDNLKRKELSQKIFKASTKSQTKQEPKKEDQQNNWWLFAMIPLAAVAVYQGVKYFKNK